MGVADKETEHEDHDRAGHGRFWCADLLFLRFHTPTESDLESRCRLVAAADVTASEAEGDNDGVSLDNDKVMAVNDDDVTLAPEFVFALDPPPSRPARAAGVEAAEEELLPPPLGTNPGRGGNSTCVLVATIPLLLLLLLLPMPPCALGGVALEEEAGIAAAAGFPD